MPPIPKSRSQNPPSILRPKMWRRDKSPRCLGIQRELQNSPNRESDDALILKAVLQKLKDHGVRTDLLPPEEADSVKFQRWDMVLPMCESYPRLKRLETEISQNPEGPIFVNPPHSVLNCYRTRMVPILSRSSRLEFPPSEIRKIEDGVGTAPTQFAAPDGWWIKRGDVHNTCDHDVLRISQWSEMAQVLKDFQSREITHFIVQPHIPGDLVKFYGVGPGRWFTWFYHNPGQANRLPFAIDDLRSSSGEAAAAMGLEIFGGDAIISEGNTVTVIDINSWPSFARVRDEASLQIAAHLRDKLFAAVSE